MNTPLTTTLKIEPDVLDELSTPDHSTNNFEAENSPLNAEDGDSVSISSKKIRKKRNTYQKIDDNIRVLLLEAVRQGETLKAAAKRFNINYSSAKSILHTFRKEGRILKKSGSDRFFIAEDFPQYEHMHHTATLVQNPFLAQKMATNVEAPITAPRIDFGAIPMSPSHGLAESFGSLLKLGTGNMQMAPQHPSSIFAKFSPRFSPSMQHVNQGAMNHQANVLGINMSPVNAASLSQMLQTTPLDKMKYFDNFYMNYSNSPLSGGGGRVMNESTDSSKHSSSRPSQYEFESFSDMVSALQNQPRQAEENLIVPHAVRMSPGHKVNGQMEWEGTLENAAMDTYKSFMDAQILLQDALKKANYLNNLVQIQKVKTDGSPLFGQLQGFKMN